MMEMIYGWIQNAVQGYLAYMAWVKAHVLPLILSWWGLTVAATAAVSLAILARYKMIKS